MKKLMVLLKTDAFGTTMDLLSFLETVGAMSICMLWAKSIEEWTTLNMKI